jgi:hypothetical protein
MVWGWPEATILPWGERSGDCLPRGLCRYSARRVEASNDRNFDSNIDSNNDANDDGFNFRSDVASNARCSDGLRLRFRLRFSAGFGCRRSCSRNRLHSRRHSCLYFPASNGRYFEGHNRAFSARYQFPGASFQLPRRAWDTIPIPRRIWVMSRVRNLRHLRNLRLVFSGVLGGSCFRPLCVLASSMKEHVLQCLGG